MSSSFSRPGSGRPSATQRSFKTSRQDDDFLYECKAAFLVIFDDLEDEITSEDELFKALQQAGRNPSRRVIKKYWTRHTESLSFRDFCDICRKEPATSEDELMKAFKKIDANGDGYLSNKELRNVLTTKGEKMSVEEVSAIIDEVDENKDGKLDYKEFCTFVLKTQEESKKFAFKNMEKKMTNKGGRRNVSKRDDSSPYSDDKSKEDDLGQRNRRHSPANSDFGSRTSIRTKASHIESHRDNDMGSQASLRRPPAMNSSRSHTDRYRNESRISLGASKASLRDHSDEDMDRVHSHRDGSMMSSRSTASRTRRKVSSQRDDDDDEENEKERPHKTQRAKEPENDSEEDSDSSDDIVIGSQRSVRSNPFQRTGGTPKPQPRRRSTLGDADDSVKSMTKEISKLAVSSKSTKLPVPKNIKEWQKAESKGCFFFDEDSRISSHQYNLEVPEDSSVWFAIQPVSITSGDLNSTRGDTSGVIDTMLFVLREDKSLVTFTEHRDSRGKYGVRCDLDSGSYKIIPFTTGCRFRRRTSDSDGEAKLVKKSGDTYTLTSTFKDALGHIFDMCDLDEDGHMSRDEFNWFNIRTSGEEVNDEEWQVVEDNVSLHRNKLTKEGFIELNQMEADDNEGDTEDLWVTLNSMGFNKRLHIDEACPFKLEVYAEDTNLELNVVGLKQGGRSLETAIVESTISKGETSRVKQARDVNIHTYSNDFRACLVVENKSSNKVNLNLDCSKSKNCVSNRRNMNFTVDVPPKSVMVGHHLMPKKETQDWSVKIMESIVT